MGTIPTPPTFNPGDTSGVAAKLNQLRDVQNFWASPPRCYAYQATAGTSVNNTWLLVALDGELYDVVQSGDTGMHDVVTSNSRVVIRTAGTYEITGQVVFAANATGFRQIDLRLNAAGVQTGGSSLLQTGQSAVASISTAVPFTVPAVLGVGDYLEVFAQQSSGGNLGLIAASSRTFLAARLVTS